MAAGTNFVQTPSIVQIPGQNRLVYAVSDLFGVRTATLQRPRLRRDLADERRATGRPTSSCPTPESGVREPHLTRGRRAACGSPTSRRSRSTTTCACASSTRRRTASARRARSSRPPTRATPRSTTSPRARTPPGACTSCGSSNLTTEPAALHALRRRRRRVRGARHARHRRGLRAPRRRAPARTPPAGSPGRATTRLADPRDAPRGDVARRRDGHLVTPRAAATTTRTAEDQRRDAQLPRPRRLREARAPASA